MANSNGFWSYVRVDDDAELNRISRLARDVVAQYEMISGDKIDLFLDIDSIELGEFWREKIEEKISSAVFFIPVITPRFFSSRSCISELREFYGGAKKLGVDELIIPLLYINVPSFDDEKCEDENIKLIKSLNWKDWRELRFLEVTSEGYRRGVAELALRLYNINCRVEDSKLDTEESIDEGEVEDDSPGTLDLLATYEKQLELLPETLGSIGNDIEKIGQIMHESTENIHRADSQGKGFTARLANINRTSQLLIEPTENIWSKSNLYASQIHDVDQGLRIIIEQSEKEIVDNPESKPAICQNFRNIRRLTEASIGSLQHIASFISALEPLEKMSREIRPVVRRLKTGLTLLYDSTDITKYWVELIDKTGINCEDCEIE